MKKLLLSFGISSLMLSTNIIPILPISSVQAQSNTVADLPDGNYIYSEATTEDRRFMFRKWGNIVAGIKYNYGKEECFEGILEGNTITNIVSPEADASGIYHWSSWGSTQFLLSRQFDWQTEARRIDPQRSGRRTIGESFNGCLSSIGTGYHHNQNQSTNSYSRCSTNPNNYCLRRGDRGQLVSEIIENLTCLGYYSGVNDGIFGSGTETGIRNFQRDHSLTVDGIAGPQTRNFLAQQCNQNNVTGRSPNTNLTPNIENLANGVYLYCDLSENAPRELQAMCFSFRKTGNSIVGFYYPDRSDFEEICLEGVVNGTTVSGFALESIEGSVSAYLPSSNGTTLIWDKQGYFNIAERQIVASTPNDFTTGWIRYNSASINLNNFVRWSHQGRVPNSCTITDINNSFN